MNETNKTFFAPQLYFESGTKDIDFYTKAFGAIEMRRWNNDDGSLHVAELSINGAIFHLHEESVKSSKYSPGKFNGTTTVIGLFVSDVDACMNKAISAGAIVVSPARIMITDTGREK
jgi:PhnB protein